VHEHRLHRGVVFAPLVEQLTEPETITVGVLVHADVRGMERADLRPWLEVRRRARRPENIRISRPTRRIGRWSLVPTWNGRHSRGAVAYGRHLSHAASRGAQ